MPAPSAATLAWRRAADADLLPVVLELAQAFDDDLRKLLAERGVELPDCVHCGRPMAPYRIWTALPPRVRAALAANQSQGCCTACYVIVVRRDRVPSRVARPTSGPNARPSELSSADLARLRRAVGITDDDVADAATGQDARR